MMKIKYSNIRLFATIGSMLAMYGPGNPGESVRHSISGIPLPADNQGNQSPMQAFEVAEGPDSQRAPQSRCPRIKAPYITGILLCLVAFPLSAYNAREGYYLGAVLKSAEFFANQATAPAHKCSRITLFTVKDKNGKLDPIEGFKKGCLVTVDHSDTNEEEEDDSKRADDGYDGKSADSEHHSKRNKHDSEDGDNKRKHDSEDGDGYDDDGYTVV